MRKGKIKRTLWFSQYLLSLDKYFLRKILQLTLEQSGGWGAIPSFSQNPGIT